MLGIKKMLLQTGSIFFLTTNSHAKKQGLQLAPTSWKETLTPLAPPVILISLGTAVSTGSPAHHGCGHEYSLDTDRNETKKEVLNEIIDIGTKNKIKPDGESFFNAAYKKKLNPDWVAC